MNQVSRAEIERLVREALGAPRAAPPTTRPSRDSTHAQGHGAADASEPGPQEGRDVGLTEPFEPRVLPALLGATPARVAVGRTGTRYRTSTLLRFRADHAAAKDAVFSEVSPELLARLGIAEVASRAPDKATYLQRPDLGRALADEARERAVQALGRQPRVILLYGDGLSAAAINQHLEAFHGALLAALAARGLAHPPALFIRRSRVKVMDEVARLCGAEAAAFVCGERPGLGFSDSLSAYYIYQPAAGATDADREVISNINPRGRAPAQAAQDLTAALERVLAAKKSGVVL